MTSFWRYNDVIITSCVQWEVASRCHHPCHLQYTHHIPYNVLIQEEWMLLFVVLCYSDLTDTHTYIYNLWKLPFFTTFRHTLSLGVLVRWNTPVSDLESQLTSEGILILIPHEAFTPFYYFTSEFHRWASRHFNTSKIYIHPHLPDTTKNLNVSVIWWG